MSMNRLYDITHIVHVAQAKDWTTTATALECVNLHNYDGVLFLFSIGNIAGDCTLIMEKCTAADGSGNTAITFHYKIGCVVLTDDTLTASTSASLTISNASDDSKVIAVDVRGDEIGPAYDWIRPYITPAGAATLMSCIAIGYNYANLSAVQATMIA